LSSFGLSLNHNYGYYDPYKNYTYNSQPIDSFSSKISKLHDKINVKGKEEELKNENIARTKLRMAIEDYIDTKVKFKKNISILLKKNITINVTIL
jgi:hypothetical protein